jgi:hypothetical protein
MSTTPQKSTSPSNTKPIVEPAKAADPTPTAAPADTGHVKANSRAGKVIVSISVDERLAKQARLLAKVRGVTISSLFVQAAAYAIPQELKTALASIKDDLAE